MNARKLKALQKDLDNARDYATWREQALEFDQVSGLEEWKEQQASDLYDHNLIRMRLQELRDMRSKERRLGAVVRTE